MYLLNLDVLVIVKSAKYSVDNMPSLWKTITLLHKDEVPEIIKLAQYALTLLLSLLVSDLTYNMYNVLCIFLIWMSWFKELWKSCLVISLPCVLTLKSLSLCNPKCNHNMNWYLFRTCVLCFFHLSLVKTIVKSAKYSYS
jgi:hypothetical protein